MKPSPRIPGPVGGFQGRQRRRAEFPQGPGDEAEQGQGEPGVGGRNTGAEVEGISYSSKNFVPPLCHALIHEHVFVRNQISSFHRDLRHGHGFARRRRCRKRASRSPARTRMFTRRCPPFWPSRQDRGHHRLRGAEPRAQARPGGHRQRHFARQSRGGICAGPQAALLFAAGVAEGIFHSRQTLAWSSPARTARPPPRRC